MLGIASACLFVLVLDLVLDLDLPVRGRPVRRGVVNADEDEDEDEKSRTELPRIGGRTPDPPAAC